MKHEYFKNAYWDIHFWDGYERPINAKKIIRRANTLINQYIDDEDHSYNDVLDYSYRLWERFLCEEELDGIIAEYED
jgi:hypothetical protein